MEISNSERYSLQREYFETRGDILLSLLALRPEAYSSVLSRYQRDLGSNHSRCALLLALLPLSIEINDMLVLDEVIKARVGINRQTQYGPPLLIAIGRKNLQAVRFLLKRGADPTVANSADGQTPLIVAAGFGYLEILNALLEVKPNLGSTDNFGRNALEYAVNRNHLACAEALICAGATYVQASLPGGNFMAVVTHVGVSI